MTKNIVAPGELLSPPVRRDASEILATARSNETYTTSKNKSGIDESKVEDEIERSRKSTESINSGKNKDDEIDNLVDG